MTAVLSRRSRSAHGYLVETDVDGRRRERDTFTCSHCQRVTTIVVGSRPEDIGGFCRVCSGLICPSCVNKGCDVVEKKLGRAEMEWHRKMLDLRF